MTQGVRAAICGCRNDVVNVVTMSVEATSINRDLDERSSGGRMANRDFSRRSRGPGDGDRRRCSRRSTNSRRLFDDRRTSSSNGRRRRIRCTWASTSRCRNDVPCVSAVTIQTIAVDRDLDIAPTTSGMTNRDASRIEDCRGGRWRRRSSCRSRRRN